MTGPALPGDLTILKVDAFTTTAFAGNAAAVVLDATGLTDLQMQVIAREMNVSETAYLLPPTRPGADLRIRWFTPTVEVDLCGHATVATLHAAMEEGRLAPGDYRLECRAGILPIGLSLGAEGGPRVTLGLPVPRLDRWDIDPGRLAAALGLDAGGIDGGLPIAKTGSWGVVPLAGLAAMRRVRPDARAVVELHAREGVGELIALTTETIDEGAAVHLRMFAPALGIEEDPVTGSAQGPVAAYLVDNRLVGPPRGPSGRGRMRYLAEQGDELDRPGRLEVDIAVADGRLASVAVTGRAVTVLKGRMARPAPRRA